mgnify:CR=1 FL=1
MKDGCITHATRASDHRARHEDDPTKDTTATVQESRDDLALCQRENKRLKRELKKACLEKIELQRQVRAAIREQESRDKQEIAGACRDCTLGAEETCRAEAEALKGIECSCDEKTCPIQDYGEADTPSYTSCRNDESHSAAVGVVAQADCA